jgi:hypothetical protein
METIAAITPDNCYNVGIRYLCDKYGSRKMGLIESAQKKLRNLTRKQYDAMFATFTDDDYYHIHNDATDHDGREIELLLNQYPYGYGVRYELYNKLVAVGAIVE